MNRLRYIVLILLLLATGRLAGQEPVIDEVCRGTSYHYRVDGEVGSTYIWELTHPDGTIDQLYSTADTILIHWDYNPGTYRLEVMQFNEDFDCDAYPMDGYVIINDLPVVTLDNFGTFCIDHGVIALSGGLPEGGVYTGQGVSGGEFDPAAAGPGTHSITYTYTDGNSCEASAVASITVAPLPVVTLAEFGTFCIDHGPFELTGGLPEGGTYAGPGIDGNSFDPVAAGPGTYTISYTFVDGDGCEASALASITVAPLPVVTLAEFGLYCIDHEVFELTGGLPEGGTYAGTGVDSNSFDPVAAGPGTHTITYTFVDGDGCEASASASITVAPLPAVSLTAFDSYCADSEPFELTGGLPEGGTYTGTGITDDSFDPAAAGPGTHTITYTYADANGCSNIATTTITIHELPLVSLDGYDDICIDIAPFELAGGLPEGGTYSGQGITGNSFDPLAAGSGTHLITYTYTDANGCTSFATTTITVNDIPLVSLDGFDAICIDALPFTLAGGLPEGGIYSGAGISGNTFNPMTAGAGTHTITYTYADASGCEDSAMTSITVNPIPEVTLADFGSYCADHDAFELTGGMPEGGIYSGPGVNGNSFDPLAAGPGNHDITYTYTDGHGCEASAMASITVNPLPDVTLADYGSYCIDHEAFELTGGLPEGGTYSGPGVTTNMFDPIEAGLGDHLITYTYTDALGCTNTASIIITVNDLPVVSLDGFDDICVDALPFTLTGGLPEGGTYDGPGVAANVFDPMIAGQGSHEITYTYIDISGCTAFTTATIEVIDVPEVTLSDIFGICADVLPFELSGGLPEGGTYSGPGIADGIFDPMVAGAGIHTYTYSYTDASGCSGTAIATIRVNEIPVLTLDDLYDVCIDALPFGLAGALPEGGTYSGSGIADGMFDPMLTGLGSHEITYTYTDSNGCTATTTAFIHVVDTPTVLLTLDGDVCNDTAPYTLTGGLPLGGVYSGDGVADGIFDPELAGPGEHIITYTYTDASGCTGFATAPIRVNPLTPTTLEPFSDVCMDVSPFELSGGMPEGGVYSGAGITNNIFDPAAAGAGEHLITYTYTDSFGCSAFDTATIRVLELPVVTLDEMDDLCIDAESFALTGGLPAGGTYSGTGVSNGIFDAETAGTGSHLITYTYTDANGCTASATTEIQVADTPDVTLADLDNICVDGTPFTLTGGLPAGGTYLGTGITGNLFDPMAAGLGTHEVTYTYTDASGCAGFAIASITVVPTPAVTLTVPGSICSNETAFTLGGGLPLGGTYSGTGVTNNMFDPATAGPGDHLITYFYSDANGCDGEATATITVHPVPQVTLSDFETVCLDMEPFTLTGGLPDGGTYSGTGVDAGLFNPMAAGAGEHLITYTYTDANGCTAMATAHIIVANLPEVVCADDLEVYEDDSPLTLSGGLPEGGIYTGTGVSNGIFDPSVAGVGEHIITYTYTDSNGCSSFCTFTITVTIPVDDLKAVAQVDNQISCFEANDGQATASATGGIGPYTWLWSNGQTTQVATNLAIGEYFVVVTDTQGWTDTAYITITQPTLLTVDVTGNDPTTSGGTDGSATADATGGTQPYTYLWSDGQTTAIATNLGAGTYSVIITDANGCQATDEVTLIDPLNAEIQVLNNVVCHGEANGRAEAIPIGGTGPFTYLWSNDQTDKIATGLAPGPYSATITDADGNTSKANVTITQPEALDVTVTVTNPSVPGGTDGVARAVASGGTSPYYFRWTGPVTRVGWIAGALVAGEYVLQVTDANGCVIYRNVTITDPILPLVITAEVIQNVSCFGGSDGIAKAVATGGVKPYRFRWNPSGRQDSIATGLQAREYTVTVTDARGVSERASITITQPTRIELTVTGTNPSIPGYFDGLASVIEATGGTPPYTYRWNDPDNQTTETATGLAARTYIVTVTDSLGCTMTGTVILTNPQANLRITKIAPNNFIDPGDTISYSITIRNHGPSVAHNLKVTDKLPANVSFISTAGGVYDPVEHTVTYSIPRLEVESMVRFVLIVGTSASLPGGTEILNIAQLESPYNKDPLTDFIIVRVNNKPDVLVQKTALEEHYSWPGDIIHYEIRVTNTGNVDLTNIQVSDPHATITQGNPILRLRPGDSSTVQARYTVTQEDINAGRYENVASATARSINNVQTTRDSNVEVVHALWLPALEIHKEAIEESYAVVGDLIHYTFTITNTGNVVLHSITVEDPGLAFDTRNGLLSLQPGETDTITGWYTVTQQDLNNGKYENIARAIGLSPADEPATAISNEEIVPAVFNTIVAHDDVSDMTVGGYYGGLALENVLSNDLINDLHIVRSQVILTQVSFPHPGIYLDEATGEVFVRPDTPGGIYHFTYEICEALNTSNCDQAEVTVIVGNTSDLAIVKTATTETVIAGEQIIYTISISNLGPEETDDVIITDMIGDDLSQVKYSINGGSTWHEWTGEFLAFDQQDTFKPGQTFELLLRGTIHSYVQGQIENTATVSGSSFDPDLSNNTSTDITTVVGSADLAISKSGDPDPVIAGTTITYDIFVENHGPSDAYGMVVTDDVSDDIENARYSLDGGTTWAEWTGAFDFGAELGGMGVGHSIDILIQGEVKASVTGSISNTARVEALTSDPDMSNNAATVVTQVVTLADLAITKTASPATAIAGEQIIYTLLITNHGPSDARQTLVYDLITESLSNPVYSTDDGNSWQAWTGSYDFASSNGMIESGQSTQILIRATVNSNVTGSIDNVATVEAETPDPDMDNNRASITTPVITRADVAITKTANPDPVIAGETLTYILTVENYGPSDAADLVVVDAISDKLQDPEYSIDNGTSWHSWDGQFDYNEISGSLAANESLIITIRGTVRSDVTGSIDNTAYAEAATFDPDTDNNSSTITTQVITVADLAITKTASPDPAVAGAPITYTIVINNHGPSDARQIVMEDILDERLTGAEYSIDNGMSWQAWQGRFTAQDSNGQLAAGDSLFILIRADIHTEVTGSISNTATIQAATYDPDLSNNSSTIVTDVVTQADVAIAKSVVQETVIAGAPITYLLEVTNHGPSRAREVIVDDIIGDELYQIVYSVDNGLNWNAWSGQYDYGSIHGDLNPGDSFEIMIRAVVHRHVTEDIVNTATVDTATEDPVPENNIATITTVVETRADLEIAMTDDSGGEAVIAGTALEYSIMITNNGPSDAQNVFISHELPEGVNFVSCSSGCVYDSDNHTVSWNFSSLSVGDTIWVDLFTVTHSILADYDILIATATVGSATYDPVPENNTARVSTLIHSIADLSIEYVSIIPTHTPNAGTQIAYSIIVYNHGPSDAHEAFVESELPENLNYVRSTQGGVIAEKMLSWPLGLVPVGTQIEITLVVHIPSHIFENTVISSGVEVSSITYDPDLDNNRDNAEIRIRAEADIRIVKITEDDITTVLGGDLITYHLVVTNDGPSFAYDLLITDELPKGLSFVSADDTGYYDDYHRTVTWSVPFLADGETIIRTVVARVGREVTDGTILTNNARVVAVTHDPNSDNNQWSVDVTTEVHPELFIPEGFSPDGDGINDLFIIGGLEDYYPNNSIMIIDRWGKRLHQASPYHQDWWDGTDLDNNPVPIGTYYYILELGGNAETIRGFIYVMRPY